MGFAYVEPSVEELNRRIAGGKVFVQSDLSGQYTETYYDPLPIEIQTSLNQPVESWEQNKAGAAASVPAAVAAYAAVEAIGQSGITPLYSTPIGGKTGDPYIAGGGEGAPGAESTVKTNLISVGGGKAGKKNVIELADLSPENMLPYLMTVAGVSGVPGIAGAKKEAELIAAVPAIGGAVLTGLGGGGWGGLITSGLEALGLGGAAVSLLGLIDKFLPGVSDFLSGGGESAPSTGTGGKMSNETTTGSTAVGVSSATSVGGVPFGGPGVPEPPNSMVSKMWKTKSFSNTVGEYWVYHWLLLDGRQMSYNGAKKQAKIWRPVHNITLGPKPRVKDLIRINRKVNTLNKHLKKQLKRAGVEL